MKLLVLSTLLSVSIHVESHQHLISISTLNDIADHVNSVKSTWKATKFHSLNGDDYLNAKFRMGALEEFTSQRIEGTRNGKAKQCPDHGLPKDFDARTHWRKCNSVISHIYDQGYCGSCWAVAAASVFSDRVCIASKGEIRALFSSQQILSCCSWCSYKDGCEGGWTEGAFSYIRQSGLATGGDYKSKQGCQPYLMEKCNHGVNGTLPQCSSLQYKKAPECRLHCYNHSYDKTFKQDRVRAEKHYKVAACDAMNEIYQHGSIVTGIKVFQDLFTYRSGVYQYVTGERVGYHIVRVIGWGEENGVPYWLIANSWNTQWGDNGTVKIKRGNNEIGVESFMHAVLPQLK